MDNYKSIIYRSCHKDALLVLWVILMILLLILDTSISGGGVELAWRGRRSGGVVKIIAHVPGEN